MPRTAIKPALTAKNNPLPDFWEFFLYPKQERLAESVLSYQ